jgi:catechol 2,3-dioxygenase-like lactoylglutathione lyase family enzyme
MIDRISHVNVWVTDQDEALEFYRDKLGLEVREDVTMPEMGGFRWLSVGPAGQPDVAFVLMAIPGPPLFEPETTEQLRAVLAKGAMGALFVTTSDAQATYEEFKARGVEFSSEPTRMPYGIDAPFRDPFGNEFRLVQELAPVA